MNNAYFLQRMEEIEERKFKKSKESFLEIEKAFNESEKRINNLINNWLIRISKNNKISYTKALELLKNEELEEFNWTVKEYIKYAKENELTGKYIKQLENASAKWHITRLEAIKLQIQEELNKLYNKVDNKISENINKVYKDTFYKTIFEFDKIKGFSSFSKIDNDILELLKLKPWASDGKNFSDRIWQDEKELIKALQQELTKVCVLGEDFEKSKKVLQQFLKTNVINKKYKTARIIMTEASYFHSLATHQAYEERGLEKYQILATLDNKTSSICREMDRKVFKTSEMKVGINAPPFHPNCRTTTMPVPDEELKAIFNKKSNTRIARDEKGKNYYVEGDLNYKQWYEKYVVQPEDKEEYNKYKSVVSSKHFPETLEKFRELKYNDGIKYKELKVRYDILTKQNLKVHEGKQGKHIVGHNNYKGASYVLPNVDIQELVYKYAGSGDLKILENNLLWLQKEFIECDKFIGVYVSEDKKEQYKTKKFSIHYSKTGVHIVPRK